MPSPRDDLHRRFVERFSVQRYTPADEAALAAAEARLTVRFPESYRSFMTLHGGAYTPDLLDLIVDRQLDYPDLKNIEPLKDVTEGTEAYWGAGMPNNLVLIGSDSMGNAFCFERVSTTRDDAPVMFFDHDFNDVSEVAASFDSLLERFLKDGAVAP